MTVYCPNCGKPNTDEATQCISCGSELKKVAPVKSPGRFKGTMMMSSPAAAPPPGGATPPAGAPPAQQGGFGAPPAQQGGFGAPAAQQGSGPVQAGGKKKDLAFQQTMLGPLTPPADPGGAQQGGFGAPPAQQGGFGSPAPQQPQGGFGAPPAQQGGFGASAPQQPQGGFGTPPAQQGGFGSPAPQQPQGGFGAPAAQQGGFGTPAPQQPQGGFGAPPAQQGGFGAPPAQQGGFGTPAPQQPQGGFGAAQQGGFGAPAPSPASESTGGFSTPAAAPASSQPAQQKSNGALKWVAIGCLAVTLLLCIGGGIAGYFIYMKSKDAVGGLAVEGMRMQTQMQLGSIVMACGADPTGAAAASAFAPSLASKLQPEACKVTNATVATFSDPSQAPGTSFTGTGLEGLAEEVGADPRACAVFTAGEQRIGGCNIDGANFGIVLLEGLPEAASAAAPSAAAPAADEPSAAAGGGDRCAVAAECCKGYVAAMPGGMNPEQTCAGIAAAAQAGEQGYTACDTAIAGFRQALTSMSLAVPSACQ